MLDIFLTYKPAGNASWYAQAYAYNITDEWLIPYWRGVGGWKSKWIFLCTETIWC